MECFYIFQPDSASSLVGKCHSLCMYFITFSVGNAEMLNPSNITKWGLFQQLFSMMFKDKIYIICFIREGNAILRVMKSLQTTTYWSPSVLQAEFNNCFQYWSWCLVSPTLHCWGRSYLLVDYEKTVPSIILLGDVCVFENYIS